MASGRPIVERFWEKVNKNGPIHPYKPGLGRCWIWCRALNSSGYGSIREGSPSKKMLGAHRVSYEIHNGKIAESLIVRHTCDNPPCVNPAHLVEDTQLGNIRDMNEKGRQVRGEENGRAKLTELEIEEIRRDYVYGSSTEGVKALGRKYGVHFSTVHAVVKEKAWKKLHNQKPCDTFLM